MKSLRILVFTHGYPPLQIAGAEQQIQRKVRWWTDAGHQVRVVSANPVLRRASERESLSETVETLDRAEVHRVGVIVPDSTRPLDETYRHPELESIVSMAIEEFNPDLVYQVSGYIFGVIPLEIAHQRGIATALFVTDYWHICQRLTFLRPSGVCCPGPRDAADCASCRLTARRTPQIAGQRVNHLAWRMLAFAGRQKQIPLLPEFIGTDDFQRRDHAIADALSHVSLVVVNSQFLADWMMRLDIPSERIINIRQGLPADQSDHLMVEASIRKPEAPVRILFLGQVTYHKGVDLLAHAVARLVDEGLHVELNVYGPQTNGPLQLRKLSPDAQDRIRILPPISREDVARALAQSDLLVAPSRWYENSPNVILEAQAAGLPVITANHGGMAEMVRDGVDGLLFDAGDEVSLYHALRRFVTSPDLREELRQNVRPPHDIATEMAPEDEAIQSAVLRSIQQPATPVLEAHAAGND